MAAAPRPSAPTSGQLALAAAALTPETIRSGTERAVGKAGLRFFDSIPPGWEEDGKVRNIFRMPVVFRAMDPLELVECNPDRIRVIEVTELPKGTTVSKMHLYNPGEPRIPTVECGGAVIPSPARTVSTTDRSPATLRAISAVAIDILTPHLASLSLAPEAQVTVWVPVEETIPHIRRIAP